MLICNIGVLCISVAKTPAAPIVMSLPLRKETSNTTLAKSIDSSFDSPCSGRNTPIMFDDSDISNQILEMVVHLVERQVTNGSTISKYPGVNFLNLCSMPVPASKVRPTPCDRREMIRIICIDIKMNTLLPGRKNLARIAEMMVAKYKDAFCDTIGYTVIGLGYKSLRKQLEEKMANLNRKTDKAIVKLNVSSDDDNESETKVKAKKILELIHTDVYTGNRTHSPATRHLPVKNQNKIGLLKSFPRKTRTKPKFCNS